MVVVYIYINLCRGFTQKVSKQLRLDCDKTFHAVSARGFSTHLEPKE